MATDGGVRSLLRPYIKQALLLQSTAAVYLVNPGNEQQRKVLGGQGMAELKALPLVAMLSPEKLKLRMRLHALGNDPLFEVSPHPNHRADDGCIIRVGGDVAYKGLVDLQGINREVLQIAQA